MPTAPVQKDDLLAGKYRVDRVLGVGGMGVVVAAQHIQLDEKVALKFLLPDMLGNPESVERFAREARAAVKIKSEHVARVSDVGTLENGAPYMVMEYLEGRDLGAWLAERGPLPLEQAVEFALQACEALAEAHGLGIVHRDLKPTNLYVIRRADGLLSTKVLDFGISKAIRLRGSGRDLSMTKTTALVGSPLYMSPEQLESAKYVDARTDIWALGVTLYELLTGRRPFEADTLPELVVQILSMSPQPPRSLRPDLPPELEPVLLRCLAKNRDARYRNVADLATALQPFGPKRARVSVERISRVIQVAGLSTSAAQVPPSSNRPPQSSALSGTVDSWGQATCTRDRPRRFLIPAAVLLFGVGAVFCAARLGGGAQTAPLSPDAPRTTGAPSPQPAEPVKVEPLRRVEEEQAIALPVGAEEESSTAFAPRPSVSAKSPTREKPPATSGAKRQPSVTSHATAAVVPSVTSAPNLTSAPLITSATTQLAPPAPRSRL